MPVYTDASGKRILVEDKDKAPPTTSAASLLRTVTHLPPHKAAAMVTTRELSVGRSKDGHQDRDDECSTNAAFQAVTPKPSEPSPSVPPADEVAQAQPSTVAAPGDLKLQVDIKTSLNVDKDPFSTTLQTFSTMPTSSDTASPKLAPRLSIDLSNIPAQHTTPFKRHARRNSKSPSPVGNPKNALLAYNQYGEIVKMKDMMKPKDPATLSVVETLRLIDKVYGYDFRARMAKVIEVQMEERTSSDEGTDKPRPSPIPNLSQWDYADFAMSPSVETPCHQTTLVYSGPPRVLEIGCGNGSWCFASKERHPDWIVEGVDDIDHWTESRPDLVFRDFTTPPEEREKRESSQPVDYFQGFQLSQEHPEFTVRNLNALLAHSEPIPHNLYGLVRGRDVFDRVESYKEFLEDVRLILQPDGVVEFVELDPRPREDFLAEDEPKQVNEDDHVSGPVTDWTDKIADRFKDPELEEVATSVPGWTERVKERLKANLRPKDGVPASQLKGWLEGAGFWDVKEFVFRLQIGGEAKGGKLLQEIVESRIDMEQEISLLAKKLPQVEPSAPSSGFYYFNLHIVTGRKPKYPRPGDLLLDGTRQEMTNSKYDAMAKLNDAKSNQWKRFDLDGKLTSMMKTLGGMGGGMGGVGAMHGSEATTPVAGSPKKVLSLGVAKGQGKGGSEASSGDA